METQTKELMRDRQDLSRQVCHLLQIIEQARGGGKGPMNEDSVVTSDMSGNDVITKRLVTFGDIQELQQNNVQLLAIVRDLTTKVEEMDEIKSHMDQATYEAKIENYTRRLQEVIINIYSYSFKHFNFQYTFYLSLPLLLIDARNHGKANTHDGKMHITA